MVNVDEFIQLSDEMVEFCLESQEIDYSLEIYNALNIAIKECGGISKSLEMMFGENFESTASMEEESAAQEKGWLSKLWTWVKDFFAKLWAWLKSWFQTRDGMIKKMEELKSKIDTVKYPVIVPNYTSALLKYNYGALLISTLESLHKEVSKIVETVAATGPQVNEGNIDRKKIFDTPPFKAVANSIKAYATGDAGVFTDMWEQIKAKLSWEGIKYSNGNTEMNRDEFLSSVNAVIAGLQMSNKVSDSYGAIEEEFKKFLEKDKSSMVGLRAKMMVAHVWMQNQKFFRALIRIGNLYLQRAEIGQVTVNKEPAQLK